ncbi:acyltransferase domain-containing protein [Nocardia nova]|uniref:acyltransferase domain-containing protein n=1 Tax=Nocardia nova TaxID=37330 RepID=UPI0033EF11AB
MKSTQSVGLLFPGQGAQYPQMASGLYRHSRIFTAHMDRAFEQLSELGTALRNVWLDPEPGPGFDDVMCAQPLLYAVNYALGAMVLDWGVEPSVLIGHSVGELAAATLAGVLSFDTGLALMRDRVTNFADTPPGGMLVVAAGQAEIQPLLFGSLAVAALNSANQTLVAGTRSELDELRITLRAKRISSLGCRAEQAFHSSLVAEAAARTLDAWRGVTLSPPRIPIHSTHLGAPLDAATATDPEFWAAHPATPVLFWPVLDELLHTRELMLVEAGPGQSLSMLARRHPAVIAGRSEVFAVLPARSAGPEAERAAAGAAMYQLAAAGHLTRPAALPA